MSSYVLFDKRPRWQQALLRLRDFAYNYNPFYVLWVSYNYRKIMGKARVRRKVSRAGEGRVIIGEAPRTGTEEST